jgi:tyrosyl-tRNA synthetase
MPVRPNEEELQEFLTRATHQVVVREDLERALRSGERRLRIKEGFDPTHPNLHIGHALGLRKLRKLAQWGHEIVVIVGDWTTQIGDPTDRDLTRPTKDRAEVMANAQTYLDQFHLIVPREGTRVVFQDEWYGKFGLRDVIELASRATVQQMLAREEFRKRQAAGTPIPIKDILYPLLQAYDSVAIEADVEVGGTDQLFNILAGRELQAQVGQRPQNVFITQLLEGLDGEKMSKSKPHTGVWITDPPHEMFGKTMSIADALMPHWFEWGTEMPMAEVRGVFDALSRKDMHPREAKERLARQVVTEFHSAAAAEEAARAWARQFRDRQAPTPATSTTLAFETPEVSIVDVLVALKRARNKAEARNAVAAGGVTVDGSPATLETKLARGARVLIQVSRHAFDVQIAP